ncbi:sulfatase-like hydrolase/transferase [Verrucomicrobiaceae bacterium 227]
MKRFLSLAGCSLALLTHSLSAQTPNIVVILVDDMGYGDLSSYNPDAKTSTPRLDALAASGMRFTDFHTNSAVCTPTRYGLLTGRYAWRTRLKSGVLDGSSRRLISAERDTIAKMLKRQNYRTASIGKWHLGMTETDGLTSIYQTSEDADRQLGTNDVGFDYWYGIPASLDHIPYTVVSDGSLVNMTDDTPSPDYSTWPNQPASASPRFIRAGKVAPGFDFEKLMARLGTKVTDYISDHVANHNTEPFFLYHPLPAPHAPWVPDIDTTGMTPEEIYIAYIDQIDTHVGTIIDNLEDPNGDGDTSDSITDETLLVFTSDNGADSKNFNEATSGHDMNGNWRGQKADIFEGGHRVPFFIKWPGQIAAGSTTDEPTCMTDLFATFADITGESYGLDAGEDSYSLKKLLLGEPFESPLRGPIVHHSLSGMFAIREGNWKLIFGIGSGGFSGADGEGSNTNTDDTPQRLYDLAANPAELVAQNQLASEAAITTDLHTKLDAIRDNPRSAPHPDLEDDDMDGMNNGFEDLYGFDRNDASDASTDFDNDGISNLNEFKLGTNPTEKDSDGDKRPDGTEDANQNGIVEPNESNPAKRDSDGDNIDDLIEAAFETDFNDGASFPQPGPAGTAQCLIRDQFENGDIPTAVAGENGGVVLVNNSVADGHSLSEVGGLLAISTGTGTNGNVGAATLTALDFAGASAGLRLTWEIDSLSTRPQSNGLFLGIAEGTGFYRSASNIGLVFFGKATTQSITGFSLVLNDSDAPVGPILDPGSEVNLDSLLDGFTATLDLTPEGYGYTLTGLKDTEGVDTLFTQTGTWAEHDLPSDFYANLATDHRQLTSVQRNPSEVVQVNLAGIKAEALGSSSFQLIARLTNESATPAAALVWNSGTGESYRIESSVDLETWQEVTAGVPSSGALTTYLDEDPLLPPANDARPHYFYRIIVE